MREFRSALDDAMALIHADPARAAAAYLALAREKVDAAEATEIIRKLNDRFEIDAAWDLRDRDVHAQRRHDQDRAHKMAGHVFSGLLGRGWELIGG